MSKTKKNTQTPEQILNDRIIVMGPDKKTEKLLKEKIINKVIEGVKPNA
jgi:hypothetical protein|tara:strand:+ start:1599 stop:1745 length:147 start_codon:yes stop_codon:yes gene_type:complete